MHVLVSLYICGSNQQQYTISIEILHNARQHTDWIRRSYVMFQTNFYRIAKKWMRIHRQILKKQKILEKKRKVGKKISDRTVSSRE